MVDVAIRINIDVMLAKRKMSVTELSERVGKIGRASWRERVLDRV